MTDALKSALISVTAYSSISVILLLAVCSLLLFPQVEVDPVRIVYKALVVDVQTAEQTVDLVLGNLSRCNHTIKQASESAVRAWEAIMVLCCLTVLSGDESI